MTASLETKTGVGRVARVTGPVVDVEFPVEAMPSFSGRSRSTSSAASRPSALAR